MSYMMRLSQLAECMHFVLLGRARGAECMSLNGYSLCRRPLLGEAVNEPSFSVCKKEASIERRGGIENSPLVPLKTFQDGEKDTISALETSTGAQGTVADNSNRR